jgi:hypothetical protein
MMPLDTLLARRPQTGSMPALAGGAAPPQGDIQAELMQRLEEMEQRRQAFAMDEGGPTGPAAAVGGLLAPYQAAITAAPTTSTLGGSLDTLMGLQQQQQGGWEPQGGAPDGTGPLRTINGVTMVAPAMRSLSMLKRDLGLPIFGQVISSFRTRAQQAELYRRYKAGNGNLAAPPGQSNHETGNAVDISSSWLASNPQVKRWLLQHGWTNDVPGEPWHWQYGV